MRYLLDTHILFWSMSDETKLSEQVLLMINDPENEIMFSSASVWEVVIKHDKNPTGMPVGGKEFLEGEPPHNDPFDRILIAQAKSEGITLITHDRLFKGYGEKCVLTI